nr:hypothetical protein [Enterovibrio nigricans]
MKYLSWILSALVMVTSGLMANEAGSDPNNDAKKGREIARKWINPTAAMARRALMGK